MKKQHLKGLTGRNWSSGGHPAFIDPRLITGLSVRSLAPPFGRWAFHSNRWWEKHHVQPQKHLGRLLYFSLLMTDRWRKQIFTAFMTDEHSLSYKKLMIKQHETDKNELTPTFRRARLQKVCCFYLINDSYDLSQLSLPWSIKMRNQLRDWLFSLVRMCSVNEPPLTAGPLSRLDPPPPTPPFAAPGESGVPNGGVGGCAGVAQGQTSFYLIYNALFW